jgi:preprotein translocase subunit SecG
MRRRICVERGNPVKDALDAAQLILSISLIALILMQSRGTSLGSVFGQEGSVFHTRRGAERVLFNVTIGVAVTFMVISLFYARVA